MNIQATFEPSELLSLHRTTQPPVQGKRQHRTADLGVWLYADSDDLQQLADHFAALAVTAKIAELEALAVAS